MLTQSQVKQFRRAGHLTVSPFFDTAEIEQVSSDLDNWQSEFLESLSDTDRCWYLEQGTGEQTALRKLDNPVFHRDVFRAMAKKPGLISIVQQLIGSGVSVFFSQVFMKPPEVGGPKPIHQDNFYFGPSDPDATLTVWIALDEATTENGCLYYSDRHQDAIIQHVAPPEQPFNLQIPAKTASKYDLVAAPVSRGGLSLHHGNTLHQSSSNRSQYPRRAAAFHYIRSNAFLVNPALDFDESVNVVI